MRIKIIKSGIFGLKGEVPIGTEIDLNSEPPAGWYGRFEVISEASAESTSITNPALTLDAIETMDRADVLAALEARNWQVDKRMSVEKMRSELSELVVAAK